MGYKARLRDQAERSEYYSVKNFNTLRTKLIDTSHRVSGKHVHSTAADKSDRWAMNGTTARSGKLRNQKTYYPDMTGLKTGTIF